MPRRRDMATELRRCIVFAALALCLTLPPAASAAASFDAGGVRVRTPVRSLHEMRQAGVVRQRWDLSCGPAALSTILTYHYRDAVSEAAVVTTILKRADPVKIRSQGGFSLLDLKRFAQSRGYQAKGYAGLTLGELAELDAPAIVPIRLNGYSHFVVFRRLSGDRVSLADPAFGAVTMKAARFQELWQNGIGFIVLRQDAALPRSLASRSGDFLTPDGSAVSRSLLRITPTPPTRRGL